MRSSRIACASILFCLVGGFVEAETIVQVQGISPAWTDSGIDVMAQDILNIQASGSVWYNRNDSAAYTDPNGLGPKTDGTHPAYEDYIVPGSHSAYTLIGKIGGTDVPGTGIPLTDTTGIRGPGFVGSSYTAPAPATGRLFLAFNDGLRHYKDNGGSYAVSVETWRRNSWDGHSPSRRHRCKRAGFRRVFLHCSCARYRKVVPGLQ